MIAVGKRNRRIRIERDGLATHDGYRNVSGAPTTIAVRWARYQPGAGGERFANAEIAATAPAIFEIDWSSAVADVNPRDRIAYDGRMYDISRVEEIGRREGLRIFAVARAD